MDYSNVEEKFGIDIAEQFLDFIAVNNGINTNICLLYTSDAADE